MRFPATRRIPAIMGLASAALLAVVVLAADANVNAGKSSLVATFKQEGVPVDAPFKSFSGSIIFDAAKPEAGTASFDVNVGSLDIGDESYNEEVRGKDWFDSARHPMATFRSTGIKAGSNGAITVAGNLTIKGRVLAISIPVSVQTAAGISTYSGSYLLSRKSFGIGAPSWDEVLEDKVKVTFKLVTTAKS